MVPERSARTATDLVAVSNPVGNCPECGEAVVDGQGVLGCPDCGWAGVVR